MIDPDWCSIYNWDDPERSRPGQFLEFTQAQNNNLFPLRSHLQGEKDVNTDKHRHSDVSTDNPIADVILRHDDRAQNAGNQEDCEDCCRDSGNMFILLNFHRLKCLIFRIFCGHVYLVNFPYCFRF